MIHFKVALQGDLESLWQNQIKFSKCFGKNTTLFYSWFTPFFFVHANSKIRCNYQPSNVCKAVILKLVVSTLLRVAKCPKRVAKFETRNYLAKNKGFLRWYLYIWRVVRILEGREISKTSLWVASQKSLRPPCMWDDFFLVTYIKSKIKLIFNLIKLKSHWRKLNVISC